MNFLIVGLGNPGEKYSETRHNIGFKVVEKLAADLGVPFTLDRHAEVSKGALKGRKLTLIKPTTYMNLSGKAVAYWMQQMKVPLENVLVITDDLALPFGTLRMKGKGSDGGHNGLADIQRTLGTPNYARLRFGVGNDFAKGRQVDYVLGEWSPDEKERLIERIEQSAAFVKSFVSIGLAHTMSQFNNK